jgi:diacylglycerol kinase family enzyme
VCNGAFVGAWNVAPRAHPGDGRLDVIDSRLSLPDRFRARRRLPAGTHVPHPDISLRRVTAVQFDLDPDLDVYLDGRPLGRARALSVRVEPGAIRAWI